MLAWVSASVCKQPPSESATPINAPAMRQARPGGPRSRNVLAVIGSNPSPALVGDKAVGAAIAACRLDAPGHAIDAIDAAEQLALRIRRGGKPVVGTRQILLCDGAHTIGRHKDHPLGLGVYVVAAAEQRGGET